MIKNKKQNSNEDNIIGHKKNKKPLIILRVL